jgi:hypothetical protein
MMFLKVGLNQGGRRQQKNMKKLLPSFYGK